MMEVLNRESLIPRLQFPRHLPTQIIHQITLLILQDLLKHHRPQAIQMENPSPKQLRAQVSHLIIHFKNQQHLRINLRY